MLVLSLILDCNYLTVILSNSASDYYPVKCQEYPGDLADQEGDNDGDDHLGQGQLCVGGHCAHWPWTEIEVIKDSSCFY